MDKKEDIFAKKVEEYFGFKDGKLEEKDIAGAIENNNLTHLADFVDDVMNISFNKLKTISTNHTLVFLNKEGKINKELNKEGIFYLRIMLDQIQKCFEMLEVIITEYKSDNLTVDDIDYLKNILHNNKAIVNVILACLTYSHK